MCTQTESVNQFWNYDLSQNNTIQDQVYFTDPNLLDGPKPVLKITGKINDEIQSILWDTGADRNCVDYSIVKNNNIIEVPDISIKIANKKTVQIIGITAVKITINGFEDFVQVYVIKSLLHPIILGTQFLVKYRSIINYEENKVQIKHRGEIHEFQFEDNKFCKELPTECCAIQQHYAFTSKGVQFWPRQGKTIRIKLKETFHRDIILQPCLEWCMRNMFAIKECVLKKNKLFHDVVIENLSIKPNYIFKDTKIGTVEMTYSIETIDKRKYTQNNNFILKENIEDTSTLTNIQSYNRDQYLSHPKQHIIDEIDINPNLPSEERENLYELIYEFLDCFATSFADLEHPRVEPIKIELIPGAKPHAQPPYKTGWKEKQIIKEQIDTMLQYNIIKRCSSEFASPLVLVSKANGEKRVCIDYRKQNNNLIYKPYPLPLIEDILSFLSNAKIMSSLDLFSGFHQLPIREQDKEITTFTTYLGTFCYNYLPFGLKTSPIEFTRTLNACLSNYLYDICVLYVDDLITCGINTEQHNYRLRKIFEIFRDVKLKFKPSKCKFGYSELIILGHLVNSLGISPSPDKVSAIMKIDIPKRLKNVRSFVNMCGFYRKWIYNFSVIANPLNILTRKNVEFRWDKDQQNAFETLKEKLATAPVLTHLKPDKPLEVRVDACDIGIAGILLQIEETGPKPLAYCSRRLSKYEEKLCIAEKECLSLVYSLSVFKPYLYMRHFQVRSDNCAVCFLNTTTNESSRIMRWALKLQTFSFKITHKKGSLNADVDCLSRHPVDEPTTKDVEERDEIPIFAITGINIEEEQDKDPELSEIKEALADPSAATSLAARKARSYLIENNLLYRKNYADFGNKKLLVIPKNMIKDLISSFHDDPIGGGHLGAAKTMSKLSKKYYWNNQLLDVRNYCKTCPDCQSRKRTFQAPIGLLQPIPNDGVPWTRVNIDALGPIKRSNQNNTFILAAVCASTKYLVARAVPAATAVETAKFLLEDIICKFGVFKYLHSDRGNIFKSNLCQELVRRMGARSVFSSSFRPESNGGIEKLNGIIAQTLSMYTSTNQTDWCSYLQAAVFSYNCSVQETTKQSPFFLNHFREPVLPADISLDVAFDTIEAENICTNFQKVRQQVLINIKQEQMKQKQRYDQTHRHVPFNVGDLVLLHTPVRKVGQSDKLQHCHLGPYRVIERISDLNYKVQIKRRGKDFIDTVHVGRMKKYYPRSDWSPGVRI